MPRLLLALACVVTVSAGAVAAQTQPFPSRIDLPDGFQPEGITASGDTFYVGSIPTGAVYRGNLRSGTGAIFVGPQAGRAAIGLKVRFGKLFVAGGGTGNAYVYDAKSGALLRTYALSAGGSFVNDVIVTRTAAWFTDSSKPVLYRVALRPGAGSPRLGNAATIPLTGDYEHQAGFNANGIDATPNGKTLVIVQSSTGRLFTVSPSGATRSITLANGESVPNGDGILLDGRTLYVVQNRLNVVAKILLAPNLRSGRVVRRISNAGFDVPTTIAEHGSLLYAVNARFGTASPSTADYWLTRLAK